MVCSICGQTGHNRRTCPHRNTTGLINRQAPRESLSTIDRRRALTKKLWRMMIRTVINFKKFVKISLLLAKNNEDPKYAYFSWLKIKDIFMRITQSMCVNEYLSFGYGEVLYPVARQYIRHYLNISNYACSQSLKERNPVKDTKRKIKLINMRNENYLIYWVVGNIMIHDIDEQENHVNYMGMLSKKNSFKLKTMIGHRFYLIPHRLDSEPIYHPQSDKQFLIEPYLQINIHDETEEKIYIDEGDKLSELNRWKFNALKLDYLIREMIKLGAKNNDVLECILDLHDDIQLDSVSEIEKDVAGIPSTMTNIT